MAQLIVPTHIVEGLNVIRRKHPQEEADLRGYIDYLIKLLEGWKTVAGEWKRQAAEIVDLKKAEEILNGAERDEPKASAEVETEKWPDGSDTETSCAKRME